MAIKHTCLRYVILYKKRCFRDLIYFSSTFGRMSMLNIAIKRKSHLTLLDGKITHPRFAIASYWTAVYLAHTSDPVPQDIPQQENAYDCGVFTCTILEYLSRGEEVFNFTQKHMPYIRRKMILEIATSQLREPS